MFTIEDLKKLLLTLHEEAENIQTSADAEDRELTEQEVTRVDEIFAEFEKTEKEIERRERIEANEKRLSKSMGRKSDPVQPAIDNSMVIGDRPNIQTPADKGSFGFRALGEFAIAVKDASRNGGRMDPRLLANAPTSFGSEGVGADGGFAVPPDFRADIQTKLLAEENLLSRCDQLQSARNSITFPKDEITPWDTTNGIQAYWEGEADQLAQSKPNLMTKTLRLNKLAALVPVTDELLEDAPAMDAYLRKKVPEKMNFKINLAIVQGTGAGEPLGILNAGCTVSKAKESAQTADTVNFDNIINMWARMYAPARNGAIWLINQDVEPQLYKMSFEGTSSSVPAYMPANGLSVSPYSTLMGRPVIPTEACEKVGDVGDIILCNLQWYLTVMKSGGIRDDVSMHLWFDYDMLAYRFILRIAGEPWLSAVVTGRDDTTNTLSPFVTLAERA